MTAKRYKKLLMACFMPRHSANRDIEKLRHIRHFAPRSAAKFTYDEAFKRFLKTTGANVGCVGGFPDPHYWDGFCINETKPKRT